LFKIIKFDSSENVGAGEILIGWVYEYSINLKNCTTILWLYNFTK